METKTIFHHNDEVELVSDKFNYKAVVRKTNPLTVKLTSPLDENTLNHLKNEEKFIITLSTKGYAYKGKAANVTGEGDVILSLFERHESRKYFRVNTVLSMGYEVLRRAPMPMSAGSESVSSVNDIMANDAMTEAEKTMASMLYKLLDEVHQMRMDMQKKKASDTGQLSPRLVSLSGSGIMFSSTVEHNKNDILRLNLVFPKTSRPITFTARVMRVESELSSGDDQNFSVACHFEEIQEAERESIVRFVFQTQRRGRTGKA